MNVIEEKATLFAEDKITLMETPELFLVSVKMFPSGQLSIVVDGDQGVSIEQCAAISRHVGHCLEQDEMMEGICNIQVSSPGIGSNLKSHRQLVKSKGKTISVTTPSGEKFQGKLVDVSHTVITIEHIQEEKTKVNNAKKHSIIIEKTFFLNELKEVKETL